MTRRVGVINTITPNRRGNVGVGVLAMARNSKPSSASGVKHQPSGALPAAIAILKKRKISIGLLTGAIATVATLTTNLQTLQSHWKTFWADREYLSTLAHPIPSPLTPENTKDWSSGQLHLTMFQIDGYLGRLKSSPGWLKLCMAI